MITGMRPVFNRLTSTVLDRVPMDVINVLAKIGFVANKMFPKSSLPFMPLGIHHAHPVFRGFGKFFRIWTPPQLQAKTDQHDVPTEIEIAVIYYASW